MAEVLKITFQFLQPLAHGRCDSDEPEWPPSPLRVFQSLVAASAARGNERTEISQAIPALRFLQTCPNPEIVGCNGIPSKVRTQFYVPDNLADLLVPVWRKGNTNASVKRTDKVVRPVHLDGESISFLYRFAEPLGLHFETILVAARSVTHLGWGIDMVVGNAEIVSDTDAARIEGERWQTSHAGGIQLRVPRAKTLDDLIRKHKDFLGRVTEAGFRPVSPLREYGVQSYRCSSDPEPRPYCVFQILRPDAKGFRAFGAAKRTRDLAAWVRHAVAEVCKGWPDVASFVHGHSEDGTASRGPLSHQRFQYLPLPTINAALDRVEAIRRVMIAAPVGFDDRIDFVRKRLIGRELRWQGETVGILNLANERDWVTNQYVGRADCWSTVSPVILDGFDDHNPSKTQRLVQKALVNAGVNTQAEFEFQAFGFRAGVDPAKSFVRPEKLNGTMVQLRLQFKDPICGPIALGSGRFRGFGLLAKERS